MDHAKGAAALAGAGRARQGLVVLAVAAARRVAAVGGEAAKLAAGALAHGRVQGEKVAAVRRAARACPRAKLVAFKAALLLGALVAGQLLEWDEDVLARRLAGGRAAVDRDAAARAWRYPPLLLLCIRGSGENGVRASYSNTRNHQQSIRARCGQAPTFRPTYNMRCKIRLPCITKWLVIQPGRVAARTPYTR